MGRKNQKSRMHARAKSSVGSSKFFPSVITFVIGMTVGSEIRLVENDLVTLLVFWTALIVINILLFRFMGLLKAYKRTHRIQYWKWKEKGLLSVGLNTLGGIINDEPRDFT
jgi:hypothetical protein